MEILGILILIVIAILCIRDFCVPKDDIDEKQSKQTGGSTKKESKTVEYSQKIEYEIKKDGVKTYFEIAGKSEHIQPFLYIDDDGEDNWFPPSEQNTCDDFRKRLDEKKHPIRDAYKLYLKSDRWKATRAIVLKRADFVCERCKINPAVQVHHLRYPKCFCDSVFVEGKDLSHLAALCNECHAKIHQKK